MMTPDSPPRSGAMALDERLSMAAALYEPCELGADIGTDHGLLPCHLLEKNICQRMILADVSSKALRHAEEQVHARGLEARAQLICADGLDALAEPCGCVSIMGMGGETIADILRRGRNRLQGAVLVLSAHTEQPLVREAVRDIGYHLTRETLCKAAGRFYLFWRAEPGGMPMTDEAIRYGGLLWEDATPLQREYRRHRIAFLRSKLAGLKTAVSLDQAAIAEAQQDLDWYLAKEE